MNVSGAAVRVGTALACAGAVHQVANLRALRVPPADPPPVGEPVSILVPARDEAHRITATLESLHAQTGLREVELLVLDDGSTDDTAAVAAAAGAKVLTGTPPPAGSLGKPHACGRLAAAARGSVLVFVDADVVLEPHAVAAAVAVLRDAGLDLLCPWPRQLATDPAARLVQPLLAWSWMVTLPLRPAERSGRPSMVAANGQFLLVDAGALARAGGWAAVAGEVLDDIALARAVRRAGGRTGVADGSALASCRMYDGWAEVSAGYRKSLWSAFGGPVAALLALVYVVPALAVLRGSRIGLLGYAAGVLTRALAARRTGTPVWPDSLAHPVSIAAVLGLHTASRRDRRAGRLRWKGRPV
ncbi:glycosyltransferase family 2 protein [Pseudonocardia xishanensis]|uniref:Glycosyltransferase n=1 Tax=Pseudonocardia xishanensis TaxID=630995 RepID=A0ABP8RYZ3_9PSEU